MERTQVEPHIMQNLHIKLLGRFTVSYGEATIPDDCWHSRRARNLVKLLALAPNHRLHRDQVIDSLWTNSDLAAATNNFHQTLYAARHVLKTAGAGCLALEGGFLSLVQDRDQILLVDVEQFETAAVQAKGSQDPKVFQDVLALYTGDLLPDDLYEGWTLQRRETLQQTHLQLLLDLARLHETHRDYSQGIAVLLRLLSVDKSHEEGHIGLMRLYALSGKRQQAVRQYQTLRKVLRQELDAEPSPNTTQFYEDIQTGRFSPAPPRTHPLHNLPVQLTSFIGREREIETLKQFILCGKTRLITVTGAGGVGKTRLTLRVAEDMLEAFPEGIWLVELAAITDPELVPISVASAINLREVQGLPITQVLLNFLRSKRMLIILDNCEHLVAAVASLVDRILRDCTLINILTTSREVLGVGGEMPFRCPSLALPEPLPLLTQYAHEQYAALISCEAVRLFIDRSVIASPTFAITKKNAPIIAQICRRLDGIPLAIELAAARTRVLSVEQIAERLDDAFRLLTGGSRTVMPRQQTLKATIDWSYNLLSHTELLLLTRLSVFSGGWTLEAAEFVCSKIGDSVESLQPEDILGLLGLLADKSLILVETGESGEARYRMLEIVRQYTHDRLIETGANSLVRDRHLAYFLRLAELAEPHLRALGMEKWLHQLEVELSNLRLALEWSLSGEFEQGLRLASALLWFWHIHSHRFEGIDWAEKLLAARNQSNDFQPPSLTSQIALGDALFAAGVLKLQTTVGQYEDGKTSLRQSRAIFDETSVKDRKKVAACDCWLSGTEVKYKKCLETCKEIGDKFHTGECLLHLWNYQIYSGNLEGARKYVDENLALRRLIGDIDGEGMAYIQMGYLYAMRGEVDKALDCWKAGQNCLDSIGNKEFSLYCSSFPIFAATLQGKYRQAIQLAEKVIAEGKEMSSPMVIYDAITDMSQAYWALKEYDQAKWWCEEALKLPFDLYFKTVYYCLGRISISRGEYTHVPAYLRNFKTFASREKFMGIQALGILAAAQQQEQHAAVLFGAMEKLCDWLKTASSPAERAEYEQALAYTRSALGEEAFSTAWAEGQLMTLEQVEASALKGLE